MKIYYQNGMNNDEKVARSGAKILEQLTGQKVGIIHNTTDGIVGDVQEYLNQGYTLKDVLNAKQYEEISKNGKQNTIVMFSAGNEDAYKAMKVMTLEGRRIKNNNLSLMSVGSPRSKRDLEKVAKETGIKIKGQFNDWKDPVTNPKIWGTGAVAMLVGGLTYGGVAGAAKGLSYFGPASTGLEAFFNGLIGGGIGGGIGLTSLKSFHSFDRYVNSDVKDLRSNLIKL